MAKGEGYHCHYCARELIAYTATHPTRDHVMPKSKGGRKTVWCCFKCNQFKADMLPQEWETFMRKHPRWWEKPGLEAAYKRERLKVERANRPPPPKQVPKAYDDPLAQAAFENVYRDRLHLLVDEQ